MPDPHGLQPLLDHVLAARDRLLAFRDQFPADGDRAGDPDWKKWNELLARLRLFVRALVLPRVRQEQDASDFANEVLLKVDKGFPGFRGSSVPALVGWVKTIAGNVVAEWLRKERGRPKLVPLTGNPPGPVPPSAADPERIDRVLRGVELLCPDQRRVLRATFFEDRSCEEVARELGRSPNWVSVTKLRAVRRLRKLMGVGPC